MSADGAVGSVAIVEVEPVLERGLAVAAGGVDAPVGPAVDHGMTGVAGNGEPIICSNNNGWRWEPN